MTKSGPTILLLQGPVGPFFQKLQMRLIDNGFDTWRMTFNAGDRFFTARDTKTLSSDLLLGPGFSGLHDLEFLTKFDCVILFGCEKPIHRRAIKFLREHQIPVLCLEEGYIRPGYITLEQYGNNWRSPYAGVISPQPQNPPMKPMELARSSFFQMSVYAMIYFSIYSVFSNRKEKSFFHKKSRGRLHREIFFWVRNFWIRWSKHFFYKRKFRRLTSTRNRKYFVVPFQVSDDAQLAPQSSRGWNNESLIEATISSFARSALKDTQLVFKIHPLDRGHTNYSKLIHRIASRHGINDRVELIDGCSMSALIKDSAGVITINSSSGFSAIFHGVPIAVLGRAYFSHPEIATEINQIDDLDAFWTMGRRAEPIRCRNYLNNTIANSLLPGDLYLKDGIAIAIGEVLEKLRVILQNSRQ